MSVFFGNPGSLQSELMTNWRQSIGMHTRASAVCVCKGGKEQHTNLCDSYTGGWDVSLRLHRTKELTGEASGSALMGWVSGNKICEDLGAQRVQKGYSVRNSVWFKRKLWRGWSGCQNQWSLQCTGQKHCYKGSPCTATEETVLRRVLAQGSCGDQSSLAPSE